ncbi:hypothetical protein SCALM49S_01915 [Streptomyces californicus]
METRGTVEATPGWKSAAPTPATELSAYTAHSGGLPVAKATASTEAPPSRRASAMIIMRRGVNRSARTAEQHEHRERPHPGGERETDRRGGPPRPRSPAVSATGIMPSPKSATVRATKK